ncbi:hypothetical protein NPIL_229721 [Nephila pilipes]|uniref:Uncharacterized protein n=1 Tax=Nephila pilipes TaxID=299642 RepID=A0A8X6NZ72_NEPPI|nr:hypothetical protein NPIL_229721 [Nephila pilipes]
MVERIEEEEEVNSCSYSSSPRVGGVAGWIWGSRAVLIEGWVGISGYDRQVRRIVVVCAFAGSYGDKLIGEIYLGPDGFIMVRGGQGRDRIGRRFNRCGSSFTAVL